MTEQQTVVRTPLHSRHEALGAKLVPFAGYEMPVHYPAGITAEHRAVRAAAGLFDVSHMGEFEVRGEGALDLIQRVTVNDASRIAVGQAQYSAMCTEAGTVIDDLLVYRRDDSFMLVVNAANRDKDLDWIQGHATAVGRVEVTDSSDSIGLLALQGPRARAILAPLFDGDVDAIGYYRFAEGRVANVSAIVSATGYTGEDGFELYVAADDAPELWDSLLHHGSSHGPVPAGLGARDSLRLEMGYALYGHDLDEEHTALESGLGWITKLDKGDFVGRTALARQKEEGVRRRLVGIRLEGRGFPRPGYDILERESGKAVGSLTSGTVSPSLGYGVAMGYVAREHAKAGSLLQVNVRGRTVDAVACRPPFYTEGSIRR